MSSNQYYAGLNRRFEKRAALLRRIGWTYERVENLPVAVFVKRRYGKCRAIPAVLLHHADNYGWRKILANTLTH